MFDNKNKSKAAKTPLAELQKLQSELHSLREKHLAALNQELLLLEKEEVSQKSRTDKTRDQLAQAKQHLKAQSDAKLSIQSRSQANIDTHLANFDSYQVTLAQLRGKVFEKRLEIRKEKAVLKAIIDAEKMLIKPAKTISAAKPQPAATPDKKPAPKTAVTKAKTPGSSSLPASPKQASKLAPKSNTKAKRNSGESHPAAKLEAPTTAVKATPEASPESAKEDYVAPRRRERRMSDIPSHPDKPDDRLASLFDDF